jgi:hypothetical protein
MQESRRLRRSRLWLLVAAAGLGVLMLGSCSSAPTLPGRTPTPSSSSAAGLPALLSASLVYDPGSRNVVLLGTTWGDYRSTMWTWDGKTWTQQRSATLPPDLRGDLAYDRATSSIVLYGTTYPAAEPQTWEWKAGTWSQRHPATMLPTEYQFQLVGDEAAGTVIAFGGCCAQTTLPSQTWRWDGTNWQQLHPTAAPSDRVNVHLAWDPAIQHVVLFGGNVNGSGNQASDLWTWDGAKWVRQYLPGLPPGELAVAAIGYDGAHKTMVLLARSGKFEVGTWTLDGAGWTTQHPSVLPSTRVTYSMAWDDAAQQLVLVDIVGPSSPETWIWNGTNWERKA